MKCPTLRVCELGRRANQIAFTCVVLEDKVHFQGRQPKDEQPYSVDARGCNRVYHKHRPGTTGRAERSEFGQNDCKL